MSALSQKQTKEHRRPHHRNGVERGWALDGGEFHRASANAALRAIVIGADNIIGRDAMRRGAFTLAR
jgi:hypothetical protein